MNNQSSEEVKNPELIEAMNQQYEDFHYSYPNVEVDCRMNDGGTFVFTMTRT